MYGSLIVLWLLVHLYFFSTLGVKIVPDSAQRYIPYANQIAQAGYLEGSQENRYVLYVTLLALFSKVEAGLIIVVLIQIAVSGVACMLLFKTVKYLTNSLLFAVAATTLFILWKDIQYMNVYILTESLFTSFIIISLYFLVHSKTKSGYALATLVSLPAALLRPNGFIVLLAVIACFVFSERHVLFRYKKLVYAAVVACAVLLIFILDRYLLTTFQIVETYARGEVIYASDIFAIHAHHVTLPEEKESPVLRILYFILQNPIFFFKLFFAKLLVYVAYVKPYYSVLHNLSIVTVMYPLYFFTGYYVLRSSHISRLFAPGIFILQALIVAATSEDWDSRFIIPLLPVIIIFGAAGLHIFITRKSAATTPQSPAAL